MSFGDATSTGMGARTDGGGGTARSVTAFFDTKEAAQTARRDLIQAGVPDAAIQVASGAEATAASAPHEHGFWASLREFFLPDEDRFSYAEGLRRGGCTLAVRTDEASYDNVLDILDRDGAVDMDEREASWREQGWPGYDGREPAGSMSDRSESPVYEPPGNATAGFGASYADDFHIADESAPATASPVPQSAPLAGPAHRPPREDLDEIDRGGTGRSDGPGGGSSSGSRVGRTTEAQIDEPDSAYAPEIERLNPASTGSPDRAYAASAPGLTPSAGSAGVATRDLSHGRSRVRSYVVEKP